MKLSLGVALASVLLVAGCGSRSTSPDPAAPQISPHLVFIAIGETVDLTIDRAATCTSSGGALLQTGMQLRFTAPTDITAVTDYEIRCVTNGVLGTSTVTVQGPAFITLSEADGLTYVRDQSKINNLPSKPLPPVFTLYPGGLTSAFTLCELSNVKWNVTTQTATCLGIAIPARNARIVLTVVDPALKSYVGDTVFFRGIHLPLAECPASVPFEGVSRSCAVFQVPFK